MKLGTEIRKIWIFEDFLSKRHFTINGHRISKNPVADTVINPRSILEWKLFSMSFYTKYWKDEFFQRYLRVKAVRIKKYVIMTRKVRISAEIDIQTSYLSMSDKLDIYSSQTKKEWLNLVWKYRSYEFLNQSRQKWTMTTLRRSGISPPAGSL